jgi:protein phosphatase 1G
LSSIDVEENVNNLCMEATMPLEQVMAKYQAEVTNPNLKNIKNENCANRPHFPSPYLRSRRNKDKGACSSSGAGCSTSSSAWNTNETDVSSSSQPCESSSSTTNRKIVESAGSSEADQILDSTTSNGDVPRTSHVGSSLDLEPAKSLEMPDSSEDVDDNVSPSKATHSTSIPNEAEINGEKSTKSFEDADSSKNTGDNECSSSCTPLENGEAEQQEKISSSGRRRNYLINLYKNLLNKMQDDNYYDYEDDDDEENDETFFGLPRYSCN